MNNWRVARHYGFGGAQIPIQAEAHLASRAGFRDGLGTYASEFIAGGPIAAARRLAGQSPAIMLGLLLLAAFVITLSKDRSDRSPVEIVMLETLAPLPEIAPEILPEVGPEPIPIVEIKPEPEPEPIPELAPPPPPPQLAERPKPPPAAKPRPRPAPAMPQIARIETPKPPPVARPDRALRERPRPVLDRPRVAIDRLTPEPTRAAPQPERIARAAVAHPTRDRSAPRLDAPAAPSFDSQPAPAPERPFRVAAARPTAGERPRPMPGLAPAPRQPNAAPPPPGPRPSRARAPRPTTNARRAPAPALAAAAVPTAPRATPARALRKSRANPTDQARSTRRPAAELARAPKMPKAAPPKLASRAGRKGPAVVARAAATERPGVSGVPLGDLAACLTDREEDRLKQAVVAAVKTQEECVSRKGTYRFIETKNLNAFLMWIDRAPSRAMEDRCAELSYALECLQGARQRAAR